MIFQFNIIIHITKLVISSTNPRLNTTINHCSFLPNDTHLILANQILTVDPWVVLHKQLRTILAFAQEYLPAARVHFCILRHIVDFPFEDGPAVVFGIVLLDLLSSVVDRVWVLNQSFALLVLHYEFLHAKEGEVSDDEH